MGLDVYSVIFVGCEFGDVTIKDIIKIIRSNGGCDDLTDKEIEASLKEEYELHSDGLIMEDLGNSEEIAFIGYQVLFEGHYATQIDSQEFKKKISKAKRKFKKHFTNITPKVFNYTYWSS